MKRVILVSAIVTVLSPVSADVYRYTDDAGVVSFTDRPIEGSMQVYIPSTNVSLPPDRAHIKELRNWGNEHKAKQEQRQKEKRQRIEQQRQEENIERRHKEQIRAIQNLQYNWQPFGSNRPTLGPLQIERKGNSTRAWREWR
jgi:hypothetical protein